MILVSASFDHLEPTRVRLFETLAARQFTITYFLFCTEEEMVTLANNHPLGPLRGWIAFSPNAVPAVKYLHHHFTADGSPPLATRTPAACRIFAPKVCPSDRHFSAAFAATYKKWLSSEDLVEAEHGESAVLFSRFVLESAFH
jgi:hypothetical protein